MFFTKTKPQIFITQQTLNFLGYVITYRFIIFVNLKHVRKTYCIVNTFLILYMLPVFTYKHETRIAYLK